MSFGNKVTLAQKLIFNDANQASHSNHNTVSIRQQHYQPQQQQQQKQLTNNSNNIIHYNKQ